MSFEQWVKMVANTLNLSDWVIKLEWDLSLEEKYLARCLVCYGRNEARIILGESFEKSSPADKRETIIHELLHCHFGPMDEFVDETIPPLIGRPAYTAWESAYDLMQERAIDAIAVSIAATDVIPLPPEGE